MNEAHQYKYKLKNGQMWLGFTGHMTETEFESMVKNPSFYYEKETNIKGDIMDIQQIVKEVEEKRIAKAMKLIEENPRLSMHHYATELDIPVQKLQEAWAKYSYDKKGML